MSFADPTLSWCCGLQSRTKSPHHPRDQCPKATTLAVTAARNPSSPLHYEVAARCRHHSPRYAHRGDDAADLHEQQHHHVPFSNIDPTDADQNQLAVDNLLRIATGRVARDVTNRLASAEATQKRQREIERIRAESGVKRIVPVREAAQLEQYVKDMLAKGRERRRKELRKIEAEMYPAPVPKISARSQEIAAAKRASGEQVRIEDRYKALAPPHASASARSRSQQQQQQQQQRPQSASAFIPAGAVHHIGRADRDVFLVSAPTPRCPSPRPTAPLTDEERRLRFVELARPLRPKPRVALQQRQ